MRYQQIINSRSKISKIDNIEEINHDYFPEGFKPRILNEHPYIIKLRRFINTEEIRALMKLGEDKFERSTIVISGELVESTTRTSETAYITYDGHFENYEKPIENILNKVCYLVGCHRSQIESMMLVKYKKGKYYDEHWDFFKKEHEDIMGKAKQRMATFFVYLTILDDNEGGENEFPKLNLRIKPSKGAAVFWWNMDPDGKLLRKTLHQGNPVLGDTIKYGLNIWIRERSF